MQLPAKLSRYAAVATLLLKHRPAMDDHAALIMQVPTTFRLLGYAGLAMILFVIAAGAGAMLAIQIMTNDRSSRRRRA